MISNIFTLIIAGMICFGLWAVAKFHADNYCQNNKPIVWIWLDDDDKSGKVSRVPKADLRISKGARVLAQAPSCIQIR